MKPQLIITDFDEVIARCDIKWIKKIKENHNLFGLSADDPRFDIKNINLRNKYLINEYLDINTAEKLNIFKKMYYDDLTFYDDIPLTTVGKLLVEFSNYPNRFKIVIISVSSGGYTTNISKSKLKFIEKWFKYKNIDIHLIDEEKHKLINEQYKDWDKLFEDNLNNIENILKITNIEEKSREILVPAYGWNIDTFNINKIIDNSPISLRFYSNNYTVFLES